jgi:hypothetical protein
LVNTPDACQARDTCIALAAVIDHGDRAVVRRAGGRLSTFGFSGREQRSPDRHRLLVLLIGILQMVHGQ